MEFEDIWTEYYKRLYVFCMQSYGLTEEDTQDVVQEILLKVYRKKDSYSGKYSFSTWVYTIARNSCIDFLRKKKSEQTHEYETVILQFPDGKQPPPERQLLDGELHEAIETFIAKLPETDRELIYLKMYEDLTYREISGITGKAEGTIKYRFFSIRKQLQVYLGEIYEQERTCN